ncbi:MAG: hypothetical protein ACE5NG_04375 [bacterium]
MKRVILVALALSMLCLTTGGFAQSKINYEIRGGYVFNLTSKDNKLGMWDNGWLLGFGISHSLNPTVKILGNTSYQNYSYGGGYKGAVPAVPGEIDGENTKIYKLSVGIRYVARGQFMKTYLELHNGVFFTDFGDIFIRNVLTFARHTISPGGLRKEGFLSLGYAYCFRVRSQVHLILQTKFTTTYSLDSFLVPLTASVQFGL